jgi:hypothetical protein
MTLDDRIRELDPGRHVHGDLAEGPRARNLLRELIREETHLAASSNLEASPTQSARRAPTRTRWLVAAAAASLGVTTFVVLDPDEGAYASWTAYPSGVAASADNPGAQWCATWWRTGPATAGTDLRPVLTEQRGELTLVVGEGPRGHESTCLAETIADDPEAIGAVAAQAHPGRAQPSQRSITLTLYDTSSTGSSSPSPDDVVEATSVITGRVGTDVSRVIVNTPYLGAVQASIVNDRFAAWWPWEKAWSDSAYPALTFDLELQDGTVLEDVPLSEVDDRPSDP